MSKIQSRGSMPPDLKQRWKDALAGVDRVQIEANFNKTQTAAAEQNFSGFVRRCIHRRRIPLSILTQETGIELQKLLNFVHGEGELNTAEIGRILSAVEVELVETTN